LSSKEFLLKRCRRSARGKNSKKGGRRVRKINPGAPSALTGFWEGGGGDGKNLKDYPDEKPVRKILGGGRSKNKGKQAEMG